MPDSTRMAPSQGPDRQAERVEVVARTLWEHVAQRGGIVRGAFWEWLSEDRQAPWRVDAETVLSRLDAFDREHPVEPQEVNMPPGVRRVVVALCDQCLDGAGGECHNPDCALCRCSAPDLPIRQHVEDYRRCQVQTGLRSEGVGKDGGSNAEQCREHRWDGDHHENVEADRSPRLHPETSADQFVPDDHSVEPQGRDGERPEVGLRWLHHGNAEWRVERLLGDGRIVIVRSKEEPLAVWPDYFFENFKPVPVKGRDGEDTREWRLRRGRRPQPADDRLFPAGGWTVDLHRNPSRDHENLVSVVPKATRDARDREIERLRDELREVQQFCAEEHSDDANQQLRERAEEAERQVEALRNRLDVALENEVVAAEQRQRAEEAERQVETLREALVPFAFCLDEGMLAELGSSQPVQVGLMPRAIRAARAALASSEPKPGDAVEVGQTWELADSTIVRVESVQRVAVVCHLGDTAAPQLMLGIDTVLAGKPWPPSPEPKEGDDA